MISLKDTKPIADLLFNDEKFLCGGGCLHHEIPYAEDSAIQLLFSVYVLLDETGNLNVENYCNYIRTMRQYAEAQLTYEYHLVNCIGHMFKTKQGSACAACKKADVYNRNLMYIVFKEINGIVVASHLFDDMIKLFKENIFNDGYGH